MGAASMLKLLVTHPDDFRTLLQFWLWHEPKRDITSPSEIPTSGWDRESMKKCWGFLDLTSRSFSAVIKELDGDLARMVCLFYLVLRGLDTIEDDMTIADSVKQPLLRSFHLKLTDPTFNFNGNGPDESDRQLLVEFENVTQELLLLPADQREIIADITSKMELGMADYCHKAFVDGKLGLDTKQDLDLYCHYVGGLVGEGLSRLFSSSGKEAPWLASQITLSNSMGLLLQKVNVLRDFHEDVQDGRLFWPKEIYNTYGFDDPKEMSAKDPETVDRALWSLSLMTLDALRHATDALDYLSLLRNQSVFNFCAIPQTMAMATLAVCFMNPDVFQRNVKIRKAEAARLIMSSTNPRDVAYLFRTYARQIHHKSSRRDPSFLQISIACSKIEQWCEHHYPSFVRIITGADGKPVQDVDESDARARILGREREVEEKRRIEGRVEELKGTVGAAAANGAGAETSSKEAFLLIAAAFGVVLAVSGGMVWVLLRVLDQWDQAQGSA